MLNTSLSTYDTLSISRTYLALSISFSLGKSVNLYKSHLLLIKSGIPFSKFAVKINLEFKLTFISGFSIGFLKVFQASGVRLSASSIITNLMGLSIGGFLINSNTTSLIVSMPLSPEAFINNTSASFLISIFLITSAVEVLPVPGFPTNIL